jgi:curved DNA-binding protein CbpA
VTPYEILGVERTATEEEIKHAYRVVAAAFHPDQRKASKAAEAKFKEATAAYQILIDPEKRALFDRAGSGLRVYTPEDDRVFTSEDREEIAEACRQIDEALRTRNSAQTTAKLTREVPGKGTRPRALRFPIAEEVKRIYSAAWYVDHETGDSDGNPLYKQTTFRLGPKKTPGI